jgi:hypothetical protein
MPTLDDLLASYPPDVQATARRARDLILSVLPDATEQVRLGWKNVTFGRGPAMRDTLFAICPQRSRVNLNLFGADLPDPAGLLEGTGVRVRHVKLPSPAAVDAPALRALLVAATSAPGTAGAGTATPHDAPPVAAPPPLGYKVDVSRTLDAALDALYSAWAEPHARSRWLTLPPASGALVVRTATPLRSIRATWPDGGSIAVTFEAKSERRSRVNVEHSRLPTSAAADAARAFWRGQLDRLAATLGSAQPDA